MESKKIVQNLQKMQKEYNALNGSLSLIDSKDLKKQAECHLELMDLCQKINEGTNGMDDRWERRREQHAKKADEILKQLEAQKVKVASGDSKPKTKESVVGSKGDDVDISEWKCDRPSHSFKDVAGMDSIKNELIRYVENANNEGLFELLAMDKMKSFLFYGPPGCGKTYIIKAFVNELWGKDFTYLSVDAADILGKYQGESEGKVKALFNAAKDNAPCIFFIDEIDNLCMSRSGKDIPAHKISLLETFLTQYNDLKESGKKVFFMAATNYPQNMDPAMLNRMEVKRIDLPDRESIAAFLKFEIAKTPLLFEAGMSPDTIAGDFVGHTLRDVGNCLGNIKNAIVEEINKKGLVDTEEQESALRTGKIKITKQLYKKALNNTIFTPINDYMEELEKWEIKAGIKKGEKRTFKANASLSVSSGELGKVTFRDDSILFNPFNPTPLRDSLRAYTRALEINPTGAASYEAAIRYHEALKNEDRSGKIPSTNISIAAELDTMEMILKDIDIHSDFSGMNSSNFINAYDTYFTLRQGDSVPGFSGTCGIIASCNVVNQQTGTRFTEKDGIEMFCEKGICVQDGGTASFHREEFVMDHGCQFEMYMQDWIQDLLQNEALKVDYLADRFKNGDSIMIILHAEDLMADGIIERKPSLKDYLSIFLNPLSEDEINSILSGAKCIDHAVTVAGFSYDSNGKVLGLWINDTGGFGLGTNRIYLSREKYDLMRMNTRGFSVEYVTKN